MDLVATPKNPIPLGVSGGYLKGKGNVRLRFARWPSALKERHGTVCIFPGRAEFIEKYFEVVGELRRRGFAVAVLDWRGQGGSGRLMRNSLKGHVRSFADYEDDVARFMNDVALPDCPPPYYALAHSMGATVLLKAATQRGCWFSRMVMTAPMLKIAELPMPPRCRVGCDHRALARRVRQVRRAWRHEGVSGEPDLRGQSADRRSRTLPRNLSVAKAAPGLAVGPPTIGWVRGALPRWRRSKATGSRTGFACRC